MVYGAKVTSYNGIADKSIVLANCGIEVESEVQHSLQRIARRKLNTGIQLTGLIKI